MYSMKTLLIHRQRDTVYHFKTFLWPHGTAHGLSIPQALTKPAAPTLDRQGSAPK